MKYKICNQCGAVCTEVENPLEPPFFCPQCKNGIFDFEVYEVDSEHPKPGQRLSTTRHMCLDIQGFLNNYKRRKMKGLMTDENGRNLSDAECRAYLADCLQKNWKVIPTCHDKECPGFDYFGKGCPGHLNRVELVKEED